ncbi:MAG: type II secretion system protein [Parcubacteria group bacterium]|nr:type II secretion system protein [Parcubacteria group bacterium]
MQKKNKGFTLIELLVVIAIIGILSSVVLASLNTARQKSRDAKRIADLKQLQLALELYFDANRAYPPILDSLATIYIPSIPQDPLITPAYQYAALLSGTSCTSYHLGATMEATGHAVLTTDSDASASTDICSGSAADFAGTDPIYDLKP